MLNRMILKLLLLCIMICCVACTTDDDLQTVVLKGKLIDEITNEGIANAKILGTSFQPEGSGLFSYQRAIHTNYAYTDEEGNFLLELKFDGQENIFELIKERDTISTAFDKAYYYESAVDGSDLIMTVKKYTPLQLRIQNVNPYNEMDSFSLHVDSPTGILGDAYYTETINGIPFWEATANNGEHLYWLGSNVDAVIVGYVIANSTMEITWNVRKNGILTTHTSGVINVLPAQLNEFEIFY